MKIYPQLSKSLSANTLNIFSKKLEYSQKFQISYLYLWTIKGSDTAYIDINYFRK